MTDLHKTVAKISGAANIAYNMHQICRMEPSRYEFGRIRDTLDAAAPVLNDAVAELDELRAQKTELMGVLEETRADFDYWAGIRGGIGTYRQAVERIDTALARARGEAGK